MPAAPVAWPRAAPRRVGAHEEASLLEPLPPEGAAVARRPRPVEEALGRRDRVRRAVARVDARASAPAYGSMCDSLASPIRTASVPESVSPVIVRRLATSIPTCWERAWMPDMSGMIPHLASSTLHFASGAVMRKSAASAIWRPPPRQWPWTAAMTGTGSRRHAQHASWKRLVPRHGRGANAARRAAARGAPSRSRGRRRRTRRTPRGPPRAACGPREPAGRRDEVLERVERQRVELVGPVEPDVGDAVLDVDVTESVIPAAYGGGRTPSSANV